jgi:hypothetical protein
LTVSNLINLNNIIIRNNDIVNLKFDSFNNLKQLVLDLPTLSVFTLWNSSVTDISGSNFPGATNIDI